MNEQGAIAKKRQEEARAYVLARIEEERRQRLEACLDSWAAAGVLTEKPQ